MGHITSKNHIQLQKRLDMHAQGAPESEALFKILEILFTEEEAGLVSDLPIKFFTIEEAAKRWNKTKEEARKILDNLASKGLLLDSERGNTKLYVLAPTMAGFFEFSLMRTDGRFDRKILSELFYQYINQEEAFMKRLFSLKTSICRTFVQEKNLSENYQSEILDYEKASHIIESASCITVGTCYCRHKMSHLGKACSMPEDVCLTFNGTAESLSSHNIAKKISKDEARQILDKCVNLGLVQIGDNVQAGVNWICNCCGCCCEALLAYKKLGYKGKISSNFFAKVNEENCSKCRLCVKKCPVEAISFTNKVVVDTEKCIGCGVCSRFCPKKSLAMEKRKKTAYVPKDSLERFIINAIENGKLQNYIFDNYNLWTNEILRHFLGVIIKLSPLRLAMAQKQMRSLFFDSIFKLKNKKFFQKLYEEGKN